MELDSGSHSLLASPLPSILVCKQPHANLSWFDSHGNREEAINPKSSNPFKSSDQRFMWLAATSPPRGRGTCRIDSSLGMFWLLCFLHPGIAQGWQVTLGL